MFLPYCERVLQVVSANHLLLNSEVFIWPFMWRVLWKRFQPSQLSFICQRDGNLLSPASSSFLDVTTEVGERQGWASNGGSVCMCVRFSLLNPIPRPNRTDFWNIQGEIAHAFAFSSTNNRELSITNFFVSSLFLLNFCKGRILEPRLWFVCLALA